MRTFKKTRRAVVFLLLLPLLYIPASALDQAAQAQLEIFSGELQDAVPPAARSYLDEVPLSLEPDISGHIRQLLQSVQTEGRGILKEALRRGLYLFAICAVCGLFASMTTLQDKYAKIISIAGAISLTGAVFPGMDGFITVATNTIGDLSLFSRTLIPVTASAAALCGMPVTGVATAAVTMLSVEFLISVMKNVIVPMLKLYLALITVNAALENELIAGIAALFKWLGVSFIKLLLTVYIAYISVSGVVLSSIDGLAIKAAKFTVSGAVPVVGSIISDATEAVLAGAGVVKNAVGVFGMLIVLALCFYPFLTFGINYLSFKGFALISQSISTKELGRLITGYGDVIGILLGLVGAAGLLLFTSMVAAVVMFKVV